MITLIYLICFMTFFGIVCAMSVIFLFSVICCLLMLCDLLCDIYRNPVMTDDDDVVVEMEECDDINV